MAPATQEGTLTKRTYEEMRLYRTEMRFQTTCHVFVQ
jgi:hypothetical protein